MHIRRITSLCFAAALAFALPTQAAYLRVHAAPSSMTVIDQGTPDKNLSSQDVGKLLVNYEEGAVSSKGATAVLLSLPGAIFDAAPADLARATLTIRVAGAKNWNANIFTPVLAPLAAPYTLSEATWNSASAESPWTTPGGDTLLDVTPVPGVFRPDSATLSFDLLPLLSSPAAADALAANGALVRLDWTDLPDESGFAMLRLHTTQTADAALLPDAYFVLGSPDPVPAASALAMTVIDQGTPDKNLSSQDIGKLLVNYAYGAVSAKGATAVLLGLPDALFFSAAANLSSATLDIAVAGARNWDSAVFTPVLAPLAAPYTAEEATWNDKAAESPWTTPGGDTLEGATPVPGVYAADAATLSFDLLPLLSSPAAADALAANGALVRLAWDELPDADSFTMLRLHTTQTADNSLLPSASWRFASAKVGPADAASDLAIFYYIDASQPNANYWGQSPRFIINANPDKGDTRVLAALPDLDLPTVASLGTLHFNADLNWRDNPEIPAVANVLTTPLGTSDPTASTWNRPDRSQTDTWDGGAFDDSLSFPAVFSSTGDAIDFDLSPLLASDLRDAAFANGLVIQWDVSAREAITNSHVRHTFYTNPVPTLAWSQHPVSYSYIDAGKNADVNFGWSGANNGKCIVVLNSGDGEARTLVKFAPSFFDFDPAQNPALLLTFPYWKEWKPADEDVPNQIALQPLTTPFRMDQATWNKATDDADWTTPGGDLDETVSFVGTVDRAAKTIIFDLTSIYSNPTALAELIENGAALRILGDRLETGDIGFNFWGTSGPVAIAIAADGVKFRGLSANSDASTRTLDLTGLDPTADYAVYTCTDLVAGDWTWACDVPDDGQVVLPAAEGPAFYRVQPRE